jgi:hypothetical protein
MFSPDEVRFVVRILEVLLALAAVSTALAAWFFKRRGT